MYVWTMNGGTYSNNGFQVAPSNNPSAAWKIVGVSDFNSDGVQDIFWRNDSTSENVYWQMNAGLQTIGYQTYFGNNNAFGWTIEDIGQLNASGAPDVAWKSPDGSHWVWNLGAGGGGVPTIVSSGRLPDNNNSASATFVNANFNSEYGYGIIDVSAAIAFLKGQPIALEVPDPLAFNVPFNNRRQNEVVNLPEVWNQGFTGQSITVAVIDNGVLLTHPALAGNIWVNPGEIAGDGIDNDANGFVDDVNGWDFIGNDNNPSPDSLSSFDVHGTQVAGMIASALIPGGSPVQGGAYNAKIMALRSGSQGSINLNAAANAVRYAADNGAKVINLSFGGGGTDTNFTNAVNYAVGKGAVVVISAGNGGANTIDTVFPAVLAGTPGVIAVGATNAGNVGITAANNAASQVAVFSTGASTTVRNYITAPGQNVLTTSYNNAQFGYQYVNGTSFSAPLVAAAVATIRQAVPGATPAQIVNALMQTADPSDVYV
jgi:subtilisin family serine protease